MATVIDTDRLHGKAASSRSSTGNGGGTMDDILKRLGNVESSVAAIRVDVGAINAILPHLATQANLHAVEKTLTEKICRVETSVKALESSIIKWLIGTVISTAAVAFAFAKYIN
jgi:hypothetical protein